MVVWVKRLVPASLGAGFLYLVWRIGLDNAAVVKVGYLFGEAEFAIWKSLLGAFLLGAGVVGVFSVYQMARAGLVSRRYRKRLARLEAEVHQLRNLPLSPENRSPGSGDEVLEAHSDRGGAVGSGTQ
jgi:uncharacterized integral membrane protein